MTFDVATTRAVGNYILHIGRVRSGTIRVGDTVRAAVDPKRQFTEKNHTATHLANWALREVLGEAVQQKGSLVDPEKLRFDFSYNKAMSDEEVGRVETLVAQRIERKLPVYTEVAPQEQALKINGLRAVFGEKYPSMVRVVSIGVPVKDLLTDPANEKWRQYSIEFCGGTHLRDTSEANGFAITSEESVSKGIRRIVALTGESARSASAAGSALDQQIERSRRVSESEIPSAIASIQKLLTNPALPLRAKRRAQAAVAEFQAKHRAWEKSQAKAGGADQLDVATVATQLIENATDLAGGKLVVGEIPNASDEQLRTAMDSLKKRAGSYGIMLGASDGTKVTFVAAVSDDLIAKGLKAGDWIRETAKVAGGGGGGRPQMAQAGGKEPAKLGEALETARRVATAAVK
jgi:alanyl-tRNA synthetase